MISRKPTRNFTCPRSSRPLVTVPSMTFLAVRGQGDPNQPGGAYQQAIGLLYAVAFTIKMSKLGPRQPEGYFDYVMPPLEGLWRQGESGHMDLTRKADFQWVSLLRLPDFVTEEVFHWAVGEAAKKKKLDLSPVTYFPWTEGLCVQCMHLGPYDHEPATLRAMEDYAREQGYTLDFGPDRWHHELYLSDPRRGRPEKRKTILRLPVRKEEP